MVGRLRQALQRLDVIVGDEIVDRLHIARGNRFGHHLRRLGFRFRRTLACLGIAERRLAPALGLQHLRLLQAFGI